MTKLKYSNTQKEINSAFLVTNNSKLQELVNFMFLLSFTRKITGNDSY